MKNSSELHTRLKKKKGFQVRQGWIWNLEWGVELHLVIILKRGVKTWGLPCRWWSMGRKTY